MFQVSDIQKTTSEMYQWVPVGTGGYRWAPVGIGGHRWALTTKDHEHHQYRSTTITTST